MSATTAAADHRHTLMRSVGRVGLIAALVLLASLAATTAALLVQAGPFAGAAIDDQDAMRLRPEQAELYAGLWQGVTSVWLWGALGLAIIGVLGFWSLTHVRSRRLGAWTLVALASTPVVCIAVAVVSLRLGSGSPIL